ncbi:MAG: N-acetylglucosamine kinase [Anaerolineae bacterium]
MSDYFLGVDGGTTKTIAVIADACGRIVGACRRGNSNYTGTDVEIPMAVVIDAVRGALAEAGLSGSDVVSGAFCLAGADWPEDHTRRQAVLEGAGICGRVSIKNDSFGGLRAGTHRPYGVAVAAGTGINAAAIAPDGREWAYGYYVYADGGGGSDLGDKGLQAMLRQDDRRGPPTLLTEMILAKLGYDTPEAVLRAIVSSELQRRDFRDLCPLVFAAAAAGDAVAAGLLIEEGRIHADYALGLIRRFDMQALEFDVVLAGSVYKGTGPLLIDTITQAVHVVAPRAKVVRLRSEPVVGGLLLAYDALGCGISQAMYDSIEATLPSQEFFATQG